MSAELGLIQILADLTGYPPEKVQDVWEDVLPEEGITIEETHSAGVVDVHPEAEPVMDEMIGRHFERLLPEPVPQVYREQIEGALYDREGNISPGSSFELEEVIDGTMEEADTPTDQHRDVLRSLLAELSVTLGVAVFEAGQLAGWRRAGIDGKMWLSQRDQNVRPSHYRADGQDVALKETSTVDGHELRFPADPRAPYPTIRGCRCTMLPGLAD